MSDMECPFCQHTVVCTDALDADEYDTWFCPQCVAERNWCAFGNKTLWQELIRTRKALDIAKNAINSAVDQNIINCAAHGIDPRTNDINVTLCNALEQIIALEQKDVK